MGDDPRVALTSRTAGHEVARRRVQDARNRAVGCALVEVIELVDDGIDCRGCKMICLWHDKLSVGDGRIDLFRIASGAAAGRAKMMRG